MDKMFSEETYIPDDLNNSSNSDTTPDIASNLFANISSTFNFSEIITVPTVDGSSVFGFQVGILLIGAIGLLGNASVLTILSWNKDSRKKTTNLLIMNQLTLDMLSSGLLLTSHYFQLTSRYLSGLWGLINCYLFISDMVPYIALIGSITSLVIISFERYIKIVHSIFHRKYFRKWMIYVGLALPWINGIMTNISVIWTTQVVDGVCIAFTIWPNIVLETAYSLFVIVWQFFLPLALLIYFYGHIFFVINKSSKLFAGGHSTGNPNKGTSSSQRSVIKTLVMVTAAFAICWGPNQTYFMLEQLNVYAPSDLYWWTTMLALLNVCINPFVYASKHEAVRKQVSAWLQMGHSMVTVTASVSPG